MAKLIKSTPCPSIPMSPFLHGALRLLDNRDTGLWDIAQENQETKRPSPAGTTMDRIVLSALLHVAHALPEQDLRNTLLARDAVTVIETHDRDLLQPGRIALEAGLLAACLDLRTAVQECQVITIEPSRDPAAAAKLEAALENALKLPDPILIFTDRIDRIPQRCRTAVTRHVALPPLTGPLLLEHLKIVHPRGRINEAALLAAMPDDTKLARLSPADVALALRRPSREAVIRTLRDMTERASVDLQFATLDRVRGLGSSRSLLERLGRDLLDWQSGTLNWRDVPCGILLSGRPGTGKTLSVRALAQDTGVHLQACSYAVWQRNGHLGDMLDAMRRDFETARRNAPAILMIDELDSFSDRAEARGDNATYDVKATNALLELLDGIDENEGVLVIGACNMPHRLDEALVRSGRFDLHVRIDMPDRVALREMLADAVGEKLDADVLNEAAERLVGQSGADVAAVIRSARARARTRGKTARLRTDDLRAAILARFADRPARPLHRYAVHEAGHVVALHATGRGLPARVEINLDGGRVIVPPPLADETLEALEDELVVLLAGRAAEVQLLGTASAAAGGDARSDLARATRLATLIDSSFGMGRNGPMWIDPDRVCVLTDPGLRSSVKGRLAAAEAQAASIVGAHHAELEAVAQSLFVERSLGREQLAALLSGTGHKRADSQGPAAA